MKTSSKIPTAGVRICLVGRSFGRSSANGYGISAWNSDSTFLPLRCGPLNSLLLLPASQRRSANQHQLGCMVFLNGHAGRLPVAFQDRLLRFNPMEACSVLLTILSMHKNAGPNAMAPIDCCMQPASVIAAHASCAPTVKKALRPSSHDGSAPFSGRSQPLKRLPQFSLCLSLLQRCLRRSRVFRCCGGIGRVVIFGANGCRWHEQS